MKRILIWFHQKYASKVQIRLTIYFLLILLPLVIVSLYGNSRSQSILLEHTIERTKAALTSSMDYIDVTLKNIEELSTLTTTDNNLLKKLNQIGLNLEAKSYILFADVMKELTNLTSVNHMVSQVSLFHSKSTMLFTTDHGGKRIKDKQVLNHLRNLASSNGTGIMYIMPEYPLSENETFGSVMNTNSISLIRVMDLNNMDREPNLLVLSLNKNKLLDLMKSLLPSPEAQIYLYTNQQELVAGNGTYDPQGKGLKASVPGMFAVKVDSRHSKWTLLLLQQEKELFKEINATRVFTYLIIIVSVILALLISWAVYSGIASPIQRLWRGMKSVGSGNFNVRLENDRTDEIGHLTHAFNKMVEEQKNLIKNHYEQQLRLANTELKFLQSQINPHFLYNTLDSIYWTAINYDVLEISEMVLNLSRFFRLSLNKGRETFTVEETVTHLNYYIRVQQLRFLESFTVSYDLQEESKSIHVLKLLLQPLVENAILYGLEDKTDGRLQISSRSDHQYLILTVRDNGAGIPKERLAYIRELLDNLSDFNIGPLSFLESNVQEAFGLRNVFSRMKLFYGNEAELHLDSTEGSGTVVELRLPLEQCRETFNVKPIINMQYRGKEA
ncbi:sensor histidine kinase [Paenibacillus sp. GCM10027626]|uniref:sensor histidine kinase n=1 Tax=Paenibacillus sp. GCM10027626 TaxID=3273411 RepID=UPI0036416A05